MNLLRTQPEWEEERSGGSKTGIITALLLFLCIIAVAFFSYQRSLKPDAELKDILQTIRVSASDVVKEAHPLSTYEFDASEKPVFVVYKNHIVKCGSSGIWFLDKTGEVVRSEGLIYSNALIKTSGSQLLIADRNTGEISVLEIKLSAGKKNLIQQF